MERNSNSFLGPWMSSLAHEWVQEVWYRTTVTHESTLEWRKRTQQFCYALNCVNVTNYMKLSGNRLNKFISFVSIPVIRDKFFITSSFVIIDRKNVKRKINISIDRIMTRQLIRVRWIFDTFSKISTHKVDSFSFVETYYNIFELL